MTGKGLCSFFLEEMKKAFRGSFKTYAEHFKAKKILITPVRKMYEQYNDVLEEAIEGVRRC